MNKLVFFILATLIAVNLDAQQQYPVTDIDGNVYKAIQIGNQIWMTENLKTTRLNDGTLIPLVTDNNEWKDLNSSAYCWYGNDASNKNMYGALYNWYTINTAKLCPTGWYVPKEKDWKLLVNFYGGPEIAGAKLKDTLHWESPNLGATNESGFTAIPGGSRDVNGNFLSYNGIWWSSSKYGNTQSWSVGLYSYIIGVNFFGSGNNSGHYVRCVKDTTDIFIQVPTISMDSIFDISFYQAKCQIGLSSNGGAEVTEKGVCWSISPNPDINSNKNADKYHIDAGNYVMTMRELTPFTAYYVRAYAINKNGVAYSNELTITTKQFPVINYGAVTDVEGNVYKTVQIGEQNWMAENLKTTLYNDGSPIPHITNNLEWSRLTQGAYCWYDNDMETHKNEYGALYNYYAVIDGRNLCPSGWHVPSDSEFDELTSCENQYESCEEYHRHCFIKEAGNAHWFYPYNTNETGFTGLPGGFRQALDYDDKELYGLFRGVGGYGFLWPIDGEYFCLSTNDNVTLGNEAGFIHSPMNGYSVRCLENNKTTIYTVPQTIASYSYIEVPVYANILQSDHIISYQFDYNYNPEKIHDYDPEILQYEGYSIEGTLSSNGSIAVNASDNKLSVAWASQTPLAESGILLKLKFSVTHMENWLEKQKITPLLSKFLANTDTIRDVTNATLTIHPGYGDVDRNGSVQAYDAALVLQYSVGLDPLPEIDPIPWDYWRLRAGNVDGEIDFIDDSAIFLTAYDASLILQYTVGIINRYPFQKYWETAANTPADVSVAIENGNMVFRSSGDVQGLNVRLEENSEMFGSPNAPVTGSLLASNYTPTTLSVGLAMTNSPAENEVVLTIPVVGIPEKPVVIDLLINNREKQINLGTITGISETFQKTIEMYPNPANTIVYFKNLPKNASISIFDLNGRKVKSYIPADTQINISDLASGIYSVQITSDNKVFTKKLIKE